MDSFDQLADFYDLDYPDTSDHAFLGHLVRALDPDHLLEIPCGSGRNVLPLLAATKRLVTFMDVAPAMVRQADGRIPDGERTRAQAVQGDLRSRRTAAVDLLICPREAFQLLGRSDAERALRSMAASITRDGLIVIDLFTFSARPASPADAPPDYFTPDLDGWVDDWTKTMGDGSSVTRERRHSLTARGAHFEMLYTIARAGAGQSTQVNLAFDMANYGYDEFGELAGRCGLAVLATADGYGGGVTIGPGSLRMVFVLGHDRRQQSAERLHRLGEAIPARGQVS
jgi:hypothetical protein